MTDAVRDTLTVVKENEISRIGIVSAIGVGASRRILNPAFRAVLALSNIKYGYRDHGGVDELVHASDTDWTLVRAVALTDRPTAPVRAAEAGREKPGRTVGRSDVARFLLDAIEQDAWIRQAPLLWNTRKN